jgi:hypothetical protein
MGDLWDVKYLKDYLLIPVDIVLENSDCQSFIVLFVENYNSLCAVRSSVPSFLFDLPLCSTRPHRVPAFRLHGNKHPWYLHNLQARTKRVAFYLHGFFVCFQRVMCCIRISIGSSSLTHVCCPQKNHQVIKAHLIVLKKMCTKMGNAYNRPMSDSIHLVGIHIFTGELNGKVW